MSDKDDSDSNEYQRQQEAAFYERNAAAAKALADKTAAEQARQYTLNSTPDNSQEDSIFASANQGNFAGFDDNGNAIIKDPSTGQYNSYGGSDWSSLNNRLRSQHGNKSYNDYLGNEQLKSIGGELQGIDEETGAAVFKKGNETFGINADDPQYKNLYKAAKEQAAGKTWFNPEYEKEFNEVQKSGNQFQGFNPQGKAVFKNRLGQYEEVDAKDSGFMKFAKKNMGGQVFSGPAKGNTNAIAGENVNNAPQMGVQRQGSQDFSKRSAFAGQTGGFNKFSQTQQNQPGTTGPQVDLNTPKKTDTFNNQETKNKQDAPPVMGTSAFSASNKPNAPKAPTANVFKSYTPPSMQDQFMAMGKGYATNFANNQIASAKDQAKSTASGYTNSFLQPYKAEGGAVLTSGANSVQNLTGVDPTKSLSGQANNMAAGQLGVGTQAITDPKAYALSQAGSYGKDLATQQFGADNASMVSGAAGMLSGNPVQAAKQAAIAHGTNTLANATGIDNGLIGTGAGLLQGNVKENALGAAKRGAINQGLSSLSGATGYDPGLLGQGATLLNGNIVNNARGMAADQAKQAAISQLAGTLGLDTSLIGGGLDVGKSLLGGGLNENSANQAGQLAARGALNYFTGGLANPELLQAGAQLSNKLGPLGAPAGAVLGGGSDIINRALGLVGGMAGDSFNTSKQGLTGLKMLGQGDIGGGVNNILKSIANTGLNTVIKQPAKVLQNIGGSAGGLLSGVGGAAKSVVSSVANAIGSVFCFDGDTEILMENGKYKKIKDIKLGDRVEIGGLVTAIGQSASDDIYDYNGVKVSGGHALFEDGKWTRVNESKYGKKLKNDHRIVYPMSTEKHIIVTKGQIWADNLEVDDTYDKTDTNILKELNSKKRRNKMLSVYAKAKFGNN